MRWIVYISLLFAIACNKTDAEHITTSSIASLRNIETHNHTILLSANTTLEGRVVANDALGEFYKRMIVEDSSGGVEIVCEGDDISRLYPIGATVSISCSGLYLANICGTLQLGAAPTMEHTQGCLTTAKLAQHIRICGTPTAPNPTTKAIGAISLHDLSTLVRVENIAVVSPHAHFCQRDSVSGSYIDTHHTLTNRSGDSITLMVNRNCEYRHRAIPAHFEYINAIVGYRDNAYTLTISDKTYY